MSQVTQSSSSGGFGMVLVRLGGRGGGVKESDGAGGARIMFCFSVSVK